MIRAILSILATTASVLAFSGQASAQALTGGPNRIPITSGALERGSEPVVGRDAFEALAYDLGQPPEQRCNGFGCMYAQVSAFAAVYNKDREQVWNEEQIATLFLNASRQFETSVASTRSGSGLRNADWEWIPNLGDAKATFTLDRPYSANFDLSDIEVGEGFTVDYIMGLRAVDKGSGGPSSSRAFGVDPVSYSPGDGNGFELIASGGVSPIPEPASWMLVLSDAGGPGCVTSRSIVG